MAQRGHQVTALHINETQPLPGVTTVRYPVNAPAKGNAAHPWVHDFNTKVIRGEAAWQAARKLDAQGLKPDLIVAHPGWGESLFLKDVWPDARLGIYCEFYYLVNGGDVNFDPEFQASPEDQACRLRTKNANVDLHFPMAQGGLSPTQWQKSVFPEPFRSRITVMHDGIDTERLRPLPDAYLQLKTRYGDVTVRKGDEVITFVNRNLEPYRGYHIFMRSLPQLMRDRPNARFLVVGGNEVSYGAAPAPGPDGKARSWKDILLDEVRDQLDMSRLHFLGRIPYDRFVTLLQLSTVHLYLTYPFVLSWSLLEAMSVGCAIVASDTPPVQEAIEHDKTGRLVDFFDQTGLIRTVNELMDNPEERARLGANARAYAQATYDLKTHCLPGQMAWVEGLMRA